MYDGFGLRRVAPVSIQIKEIIRDKILEGKYLPNSQIPAEESLAELFGVSRATIRSSVTGLVAEGLLYRQQGIGTFVCSPPLKSGIERLESVISVGVRDGSQITYTDLCVEMTSAPLEIREQLELEADSIITMVSRILVSELHPVSQQKDYVLAEILLPDKVDTSFNGSVLDLLKEQKLVNISRAISTITAVNADKTLAEVLQVEANESLMLFKEILIDRTNRKIGFSSNYYVPGRMNFFVVRK